MQELNRDISNRFTDLFTPPPPKKIPGWVIDASLDINNVEIVRIEKGLGGHFKRRLNWGQFLREIFKKIIPRLQLQENISNYYSAWKRDKVKTYIIAFPMSYLVERRFSAVVQFLSNQLNRLITMKMWGIFHTAWCWGSWYCWIKSIHTIKKY